MWDKYIEDSPQNVELSDEDIMKEVRAERYRGVFSKESAKSFLEHTKSMREEWSNN